MINNKFKVGEKVNTKFGLVEIMVVDNDYKAVKVKHLEGNSPITDFFFDEIQLITPKTNK